MHNKTHVKPRGVATLCIERNGHAYSANFLIVPGTATPLLSLQASQELGLVKITDCDDVHAVVTQPVAPPTPNAEVTTQEGTPTLQDPLLKKYADVFEGLGTLPGEYSITLAENSSPKVTPPRRLPIAVQTSFDKELDRMLKLKVIAPVTEPTDWVSAMVAVRKSNGRVRICLDPKDLNKSIKRPHYPLPTFEDVAARLANAKVFSVLDARSGFWQVLLAKASSFLTTFNTPQGRFRWLRMPFGIASAPEEWQRRMHQLIEGSLVLKSLRMIFL